jgi:hypothetical protein
MPAAPRIDSKATKIAYKVLGKPLNMQGKKTPKEKEIDRNAGVHQFNRIRE